MAIHPGLLTAILPIVGVLCGAALQFVFSRSTEAYKHERRSAQKAMAKELEEYKYDIRMREQAADLAELFATWIHRPTSPEENRRLTQLSYEASLWLPSEIVQQITDTLMHAPHAKTAGEIMLQVRELLHKEAKHPNKLKLTPYSFISFEQVPRQPAPLPSQTAPDQIPKQ